MNSRCYLSRLSSAHEAACGSPPSASAREIRVPRVGFAPGTPSRDASPTHGRPVRPRASADSFASKSAAAMMRHALSRAVFAPAPARGVFTPPARLARRPTARVVPRAGGSSARRSTRRSPPSTRAASRRAPRRDSAFQSRSRRRGRRSFAETTSETDSGHTTTARRCPAHRRAPTRANRARGRHARDAPARAALARVGAARVFFGAPGAPARRSPSRRACSAARFPRSCWRACPRFARSPPRRTRSRTSPRASARRCRTRSPPCASPV